MRRNRPPTGSYECETVGCERFTKSTSGYCATCELKNTVGRRCVVCQGAIKDGIVSTCSKHTEIYDDGDGLRYSNLIAAQLATVLINARHESGTHFISPTGTPQQLHCRKFRPQDFASRESYRAVFTNLYRSILEFDHRLADLLEHDDTEIEVSTRAPSPASPPPEVSVAGGEAGGEPGSGPGEDPAAPTEAAVPADA